MASILQLPGGLYVVNGLPADAKYFNIAQTPYTNVAQVKSELVTGVRYPGLTVNVDGVEYWWPPDGGVTDGELVIKTSGASYPSYPTSDGKQYYLSETDEIVSWELVVDANGADFDTKEKLQAGEETDWDDDDHYEGTVSGSVTGTKGGMVFYGTDATSGAKYKYECITDNNWYRTQRIVSTLYLKASTDEYFPFTTDDSGTMIP